MMKRFLLTVLISGLLLPVFAQRDEQKIKETALESGFYHEVKKSTSPNNSRESAIPLNASSIMEDFIDDDVSVKVIYLKGMGTLPFDNRYDRHTQGSIYDMMYAYEDGFVGAAWTLSTDAINDLEERDIVYAFSKDGGQNWQIEDYPLTGLHGYWPSYGPWGENGELIVVRFGDQQLSGHDGLAIYRRETKGEGVWEKVIIDNPTEGGAMVWQKICVSGEKNEYLHIATGYLLEDTSQDYDGFQTALVYNRTSNAGDSWDFEWKALPNIVGDVLDREENLTEVQIWAKPYGKNIALLCSRLGSDAFIYKSDNNGEPGSWSKIEVMNCAWDMNAGPDQKIDSGWRAMQGGTLAFDKTGKLHAVFNAFWTYPSEDGESYYYTRYGNGSVLLYWNESRGAYELEEMAEIIDEWVHDFYCLFEEDGVEYIVPSLVGNRFNEYVVGGPIPIDMTEIIGEDGKPHYNFGWIEETMLWNTVKSYRYSGAWAYPNITFDEDNCIHLLYLGLLDGASDANGKQRRHVYHTFSRDEFKTYSKHTDLSNTIAVRQNEFSYLKLGGWVGKKDFIFMTQVDPLGGTYADTGFEEPHTPTSNTMNAFTVTYENLQSMDEVSSHKVEMMVYPNPAENHFKVDFVGVCNIELYNVLGQKVYSVENVAGPYMISTEKFSKGIYFVTVRDGKKMTTQKLIVQ